MMKITVYVLQVELYDYWYDYNGSGFISMFKYFTTKEKAEAWIETHKNIIYRGYDKNQTTANSKEEMPKFYLLPQRDIIIDDE